MKQFIIYSSALLLLATSCIKDIEFKSNEAKVQPVLNSLFSNNNDSIYVKMVLSQTVLDTAQFQAITNATLALSENGNEVSVGTHIKNGIYAFPYQTSANNTYSVSALVDGYSELTATSKMPELPTIQLLDTSTVVLEPNYFGKEFVFEVENINPGEKEYYSVSVLLRYKVYEYDEQTWEIIDSTYYIYNTDFYSRDIKLNPTQVSTNNTAYTYMYGNGYFTDELEQGDKFTLSIAVPLGFYTYEDYDFIKLEFRKLSEEYYNYGITTQNQYLTNGDPFAQPVQVRGNITNGFGIFAGYSSELIDLK